MFHLEIEAVLEWGKTHRTGKRFRKDLNIFPECCKFLNCKERSKRAQKRTASYIDLCFEQGTDDGRGVVLGDHCRACDFCAGPKISAPIDRHFGKCARLRIENRTPRARLRLA